jgi:hypothetical protein
MASVARVCDTDIISVEMIVKEIAAQIKYQIQSGKNVRLMFKIGKLVTRGGEL